MMFILQLVMCLSFVNVCLGMEKQAKSEKWIVNRITEVQHNPYCQIKEEDLVSGTLKVYYVDSKKNGNYQLTAEFVPNNNTASIKFNNFIDNQYYTDSNTLKECLNKKSVQRNLSIPLYLLRGGAEQQHKPAEVVKINRIEKFNEPEELLHIQKTFEIVVQSDSILLPKCDNDEDKVLRHPKNVKAIQEALSSNKQFIINIFNVNNFVQGKVLEYTNGSYIHWKGWLPYFDLHCVGMPIDLGIAEPEMISVNLALEKEELHNHGRNPWISRSLIIILLGLIAYQFKDKVYEFGNSLLK